MNVLLLLARGTEGTGNTRITIELEEYIKSINNNVITITGTDKSWGRKNMQETDFVEHSFIKEGLLEDTKIGFNPDICIIMSVPAKNYPEETIENFLLTLENMHNNGTKLVYLQVDNKIHSINRNFYCLDSSYIKRFFSILDKIIVHHKQADFCTKFINKKVKPLINKPLINDKPNYKIEQLQLISTDFEDLRNRFWTNDKIDKTCWFIGRSALWKGWTYFREFHYEYLMNNNYVSVAEGIERSINAKQAIWEYDSKTNKYGDLRKDNNYNDNGNPKDVLENIENYRNHPLEIYGPYVRLEALERLSKAKFGMFFTFTGPQFGGQLEITLLEIVACGTIPIIRKDLYDSANFCGDRLDNYTLKDIGTIVYDENNPLETLNLMNELNSNMDLYDEYRNNAYNYYKSVFDRDIMMKKLYNMCIGD